MSVLSHSKQDLTTRRENKIDDDDDNLQISLDTGKAGRDVFTVDPEGRCRLLGVDP